MEMKSFFYTNPIINNYYEEIRDIIEDKKILNQDGIIKFFLEPMDETSENYNVYRNKVLQFIQQKIVDSDICQGSISREYILTLLKKIFSLNFSISSDYDICFIVKNNTLTIPEGIENIEETWEQKFDDVIGFSIVKRGECSRYSKAYVLNLVCSKKEYKVGSIFIGLYLYSILLHPLDTSVSLISPKIVQPVNPDEYYGVTIPHIGLLELSGGYKNVSGLCLYNKFGFVIDNKLSTANSNCFRDRNNIGMINNFLNDTSISIEERKTKILNIVKRTDAGFEKINICDAKDKETQLKMIQLYNEVKDKNEIMEGLLFQSKFALNKEKDGTLKPEFKKNIDDAIAEIDELEKMIESLSDIRLLGGKKEKKKTKRNNTKGRKKNTKRRKNIRKRTKKYHN